MAPAAGGIPGATVYSAAYAPGQAVRGLEGPGLPVARAADAALRARGIIVRGAAGYGLAECLRISIGTAEECQVVAETLAAFMARETTHA